MAGNLAERTRDFILELSDVDLAEYVAVGTTLYEPDAVEFARSELQRRNVDPNQIQVEVVARATERAEDAVASANLPLRGVMKFMAFLGGFFIGSILPIMLLLVASNAFRQRGESRRVSEMWRFFRYGLVALLSFFLAAAAITVYSAWHPG